MNPVILLYDELDAAAAKTFVAELSKLPATAAVTIALNSPGGSVRTGEAIHAAISRHKGRTTARIDGVAASAASFIAMACDEIIMAAGSFLMIHNPGAIGVSGDQARLSELAGHLGQIEARYVAVYAKRTGLDEATIRQMMSNETWLSAVQAVALHFADAVDVELETAARVHPLVLGFEHTPVEVVAMAGGAHPKRTRAARQRVKRRLVALTRAHRPAPCEEARQRRLAVRARIQAMVERIKAEDALVDARERVLARARKERAWHLRALNMIEWRKP